MLGMKIFAFVVHSLTSSLHTCLHPLLRSDKGAEEKQLSVSAIHDEGHDLILHEWHSQSIGQSHFVIYKILPGTMTEPSLCFQKCERFRTLILYDDLPRFRADYYILIYTHCHELMKAVGSHGSLLLLFVMKVMVWHFMRDSHKVKTALVVGLPSNCCWGEFYVSSWIFCFARTNTTFVS